MRLGLLAQMGASTFSLSGSVTIAPFGDSITYGQGSSDLLGYRAILRQALALALPNVPATFVGPYGSAPDNHGGDPGATIAEIQSNFETWIATPAAPPDIIILMAGTNDCDTAGPAYDGPTAQANLGNCLDSMISANPNVQIVVIAPSTVNPDNTSPDDETLRSNLADYATRVILEARKRSMIAVDLHTASLAWVAADFTDDVHLANPGGYQKMASILQSPTTQAIGRQLAPSRYVTLPEIVTAPSITASPVVGSPAIITPGFVDAFPSVISTFRILDASDDSEIVDLDTGLSYVPDSGDLGVQFKPEQTAGSDIEVGTASNAVASPLPIPTTNLVFAFEARAGVTESGGLVTQLDSQHSTSPVAVASGSERPDYLSSGGYLDGPVLRFGSSATNGDTTRLAVDTSLRETAGDCTLAFIVNPGVLLGTQQWLAGFTATDGSPTSLIGPLHIRSSAVSRPQWYDGAYRDTGVAAVSGWQLLTFWISGTTLRVYRGRSQLGSDLTVTPRVLTNPIIGNVATGTDLPLDGLMEGAWAYDAAIVVSDLWDWIEQEWPGITL